MGLWGRIKSLTTSEGRERVRFLRAVAEIARRVPGVQLVREDPDQFQLELRVGNEDSRLYLGNLYAEIRAASFEDRVRRAEAFLLDLAASSQFGPQDWPTLRDRLVPVVRTEASFFMGAERLGAIRRSFLPFLVEAVVIDSDSSMRYVTDGDPERWGVTTEEVFEAARRRLAAANDAVEPMADTPGWWRVSTDDDYECSRLLLPGWLASFRGRVNGRPLAIVPDRRTLIVGGGDDLAVVNALLKTAQQMVEASPRPLSTLVYTCDAAGAVVPLEVPPEDPLWPALTQARHVFEANEYASQKAHLEAAHERDGVDIFVASYSVVRSPDGIQRSYAAWPEGVDTLLPRADCVGIGSRPGAPASWIALVPWQEVERHAADALVPDSRYSPIRYRALQWPDAETIARLRQLAV